MFHLPFDIAVSKKKINYSNNVVLLGSCFADSIGDKMIANKFPVVSNPFGTIYNPTSLFRIIRGEINENHTVDNQGIYYHWDAHGEVSAIKEQELQLIVKEKQESLQEILKKTNWLAITFGSAFAYRLKSTRALVANCHKRPAQEFEKELLSTETIIEEFERTSQYLCQVNPNLNLILTVSPVRHSKDGLTENNRSKARLLEATQTIVESHNSCSYFPAYEILIDELRDYRFYTEDRVHPSIEAIDYIWKRFSETYFDDQTQTFLKKWANIKSAIQHRPFHPESDQHQAFLNKTIDELRSLENKVDISAELSLLQSQLV